MKLTNVKGNTWVLEGSQLLGLYRLDERRCVLLDSGSGKVRQDLAETLAAAGLTPVGVICTHMHYDHHENTRWLRETYGTETCLPQIEAEIVRSVESLKNHLFNFTAGMIRTIPRLQNLLCPVDRVIGPEETSVRLSGADFTVLRTPGHAPDHICVITPDNVCFAGDVLMTEDVLQQAMVPFVFDMTDDLASKEKLKEVSCDAWIFSHAGVIYGDITSLVDANLAREKEQLAACAALTDRPMTYSAWYAKVIKAFSLPVGHPIRALHLERYLRPYLEYLLDTDQLVLLELGGAAAVAPKGWKHA